MKKLAFIVALLLAASPAAAQGTTSNNQQSVQGGPSVPSEGQSSGGQTTGVVCTEEMTATFCNVPTGPNTNGYQSSGGSGSSGGAGSNTPSVSPATPLCGIEPPANELCN
jgi:hypothetical protein